MRLLLVIISDASRQSWGQAVADACGTTAQIFVGNLLYAAQHMASQGLSPSHLVLDIGAGSASTLTEIDTLAQQCEPGTRVVAVGDTNDIALYRGLLARGVADYLPMPVDPREIASALTAQPPAAAAKPTAANPASQERHVITFVSAASGDGASTAAINTAYALSQLDGSTVLVDMDYQFGMVSKQLNLQNQYGLRDIFDHPERGIDSMLIKRIVATYQNLHVITAPAELRYAPSVSAEMVHQLLTTLKQMYTHIVLDLPRVWLPWTASACQQSTKVVLVSQLWLKSVSHSARMMRVFRDLSIPADRIINVINRSGAKFKEAIDPKDFERVCATGIRYTIANDIKAITAAEAEARTLVELDGSSALAQDMLRLAHGLVGQQVTVDAGGRSGLFSRLKKG